MYRALSQSISASVELIRKGKPELSVAECLLFDIPLVAEEFQADVTQADQLAGWPKTNRFQIPKKPLPQLRLYPVPKFW